MIWINQVPLDYDFYETQTCIQNKHIFNDCNYYQCKCT